MGHGRRFWVCNSVRERWGQDWDWGLWGERQKKGQEKDKAKEEEEKVWVMSRSWIQAYCAWLNESMTHSVDFIWFKPDKGELFLSTLQTLSITAPHPPPPPLSAESSTTCPMTPPNFENRLDPALFYFGSEQATTLFLRICKLWHDLGGFRPRCPRQAFRHKKKGGGGGVKART